MHDNERTKDRGKLQGTLVRLIHYMRSDRLTHVDYDKLRKHCNP